MKAFVKYDRNGKLVSGSLVLREKKPLVGNWKEIDAYKCCSTTTTSTTLPLPRIKYGALYNWYTIGEHEGLVNPTQIGWRVPTDIDYNTLIVNLGGDTVAGAKLKETGFQHWVEPNDNATDLIGFKALPGGFKYDSGEYTLITRGCFIWSSTDKLDGNYGILNIVNSDNYAILSEQDPKYGNSIRLVRNSVLPNGSTGWYFDYEGNAYKTIVYEGQEWMAVNLNTKKYADGSTIPNVTDPTTWTALTTGAMCWYENDEATYAYE